MMSYKRKKRDGAMLKVRDGYGRSAENEVLVFLSGKNIYAQVISLNNKKVLASVSTLSSEFGNSSNNKRNIKCASAVGKSLAVKCQEMGLKNVVFNRAGHKFCGVLGALAEGFYSNLG